MANGSGAGQSREAERTNGLLNLCCKAERMPSPIW